MFAGGAGLVAEREGDELPWSECEINPRSGVGTRCRHVERLPLQQFRDS